MLKTANLPSPAASAAATASGPHLAPRCPRCGTGESAGECQECRQRALGSRLQRAMSPAAGGAAGAGGEGVAPEIVHRVLGRGGSPLPPAVRREMEQRFGLDFGRVRIHTDAQAARSARRVGAHAYTVGHQVVFGARRFRPADADGRRLIAHELAHVVQQRGSSWRAGSPLPMAPTLDAAERQAQRVASGLVAPRPSPSSPAVLQRERAARPPASPSCETLPDLQPGSVDALATLLEESGVIQSARPATEFSSILYRHVTARTPIGLDYLAYLEREAYPMPDFCIAYRGRGWDPMFRSDVLPAYRYTRPAHRDMRLIEATVRSYASDNLQIYVEEELFPEGRFDPTADPLTPTTLRTQASGTLLSGTAPEALLLLAATDRYLADLTLDAATISSLSTPAATSGPTTASEVFEWGSPTAEGSIGDPNRFDDEIVYWTRYYNDLFDPRDRDGNPDPLDPDLFKAILYVESRFSETAGLGGGGAQGVSQMTGGARRGVGEVPAGVSGIDATTFRDPAVQIAAGIRWLFEKYRRSGDWETAVRDYNGSPRRDAYRDEVLRRYRSHRRELATEVTTE